MAAAELATELDASVKRSVTTSRICSTRTSSSSTRRSTPRKAARWPFTARPKNRPCCCSTRRTTRKGSHRRSESMRRRSESEQSYSQGNAASGVVAESQLLAEPWEFDLGEVDVPIQLWHGEHDVNGPVDGVRDVCASPPDTELIVHNTDYLTTLLAYRDAIA